MMHFTNTLSGKKETFKPQSKKNVSMYVCGVTPYDKAHIGHGRCYVTFDFVYRFLTFMGYDVTYCRNYTDIDDKIIARAQKELGDATRYSEITKACIVSFEQNMHQLNCLIPDYQPCVTEMIDEIITFIQGLIDKKSAYVRDGSVYFRVKSFSSYGKLSKQKIDDLRSGSRIEVAHCKEDPLDFALWKKDDVVGFDSPWGQGRPGWHIECSAMARDRFQGTVDIHGGGMDLIFPHHENEIAQSESLYEEQFVNYWLHNAFVQINQEKMSKSLGNFFTLDDVFEQFDPMVIRFYFLKHHYRGPLDFSFDDIKAAETTYKRLVSVFADCSVDHVTDMELVAKNLIVEKMIEFLQDDFNTSGALGVLFEKLSLLDDDGASKALVKNFIVNVFGLTLELLPEKQVEITPEIQKLIDQREQARVEKNWALADELRDKLIELGVQIHDKKS